MIRLCFATNNKHKLEEIRSLVSSVFSIDSLEDLLIHEDIPETGKTLEENALLKAKYIFSKYQIPCFADDTGLEVDALNGDPGVYSARYAGPDKNSTENIRLLLNNLKGKDNRKARFRTIIALVDDQGFSIFEGVVNGSIAEQPSGNEGFGYDPVFIPEGASKTFAQMSMEEKNKQSHRSIAITKLVTFLKEKE